MSARSTPCPGGASRRACRCPHRPRLVRCPRRLAYHGHDAVGQCLGDAVGPRPWPRGRRSGRRLGRGRCRRRGLCPPGRSGAGGRRSLHAHRLPESRTSAPGARHTGRDGRVRGVVVSGPRAGRRLLRGLRRRRTRRLGDTAVTLPEPGGLSLETATVAVRALARIGPVIGIGFTTISLGNGEMRLGRPKLWRRLRSRRSVATAARAATTRETRARRGRSRRGWPTPSPRCPRTVQVSSHRCPASSAQAQPRRHGGPNRPHRRSRQRSHQRRRRSRRRPSCRPARRRAACRHR